ncbi:hypothetical protein PR048_020128 [Dryococelus australis]|uniref:DDE-1 domain-containing protein n=1 Tax=Dryococelus australis TaxID=614101 RepID=A0ABQ9H5J1_9NEOP|nr:hypothetical protein PR048_020128 [Dryococelus australis]
MCQLAGPILKQTVCLHSRWAWMISRFHFKSCHNIVLHKICGESEAVPVGFVGNWLLAIKGILRCYQHWDVYNGDETAMIFSLLPDRMLPVKGDACKGGKRSKKYLTVRLCCNMDGSEKMNPLVIGTFKNPSAFKGHATLPCRYDFNIKAWLWEPQHRALRRHIQNLTNTELVVLPPNTTSVHQSLDHARTIMDLDPGRGYRKWDVFKAMQAIKVLWNKISFEVICNIFQHAHLIVDEAPALPPPDTVDVEEDIDDPVEVNDYQF